MKIQEENFEEAYQDFISLYDKHWQECGEIEGGNKLDLNTYLLVKSSQLGHYVAFTVRGDYGTPIGYATFFVSNGIHTFCDMYAKTDAVYIRPDYRSVGLLSYGYKLIRYAESVLKDKYGIDVIQFDMNLNFDISALLDRLGYKPAEVRFNKRVS